MPMPRIIPSKIVAQYEQEEDYQRALDRGQKATYAPGNSLGMSEMFSSLGGSMAMDNRANKTGIERRYESIRDIKQPTFRRDLTKNEGGIVPDKGSTIKITGKKTKTTEVNPYEMQIATRMHPTNQDELPDGKIATGFPKVTFGAQQVFNEVCSLSAKVPTWNTND